MYPKRYIESYTILKMASLWRHCLFKIPNICPNFISPIMSASQILNKPRYDNLRIPLLLLWTYFCPAFLTSPYDSLNFGVFYVRNKKIFWNTLLRVVKVLYVTSGPSNRSGFACSPE
ncbi:hypothetical protein CEXT_3031 [Caerostris extrusa]|uniref:Uncharacterized protein n=1 Tax=Caerostris extrusa TaxID=172846 RepID=A0AAV4VLT5_CAEEX|nr:hypothetical protein CEXT_3031 [Caerostris extrusa]